MVGGGNCSLFPYNIVTSKRSHEKLVDKVKTKVSIRSCVGRRAEQRALEHVVLDIWPSPRLHFRKSLIVRAIRHFWLPLQPLVSLAGLAMTMSATTPGGSSGSFSPFNTA
eukprot:6179717-Amphidinium_carterae.2